MTDRKPPRLHGGERETLVALLQYQRDSLVRKVEGVDETAARRQLVTSGTTLLWLVKHITGAEWTWIVRRFAGDDIDPPDDAIKDGDTVPAAIDAYREMWARVDAIVSTSSLDELCCEVGADAPVNLRWVLMHLLEETARHAGHADIIREMIDGATGR